MCIFDGMWNPNTEFAEAWNDGHNSTSLLIYLFFLR